jgi:hypothetical protein
LTEEWCIGKPDGAYIACMEDVLDVYEAPSDPTQPRICFDELPCQLLGDLLVPLPMQPGSARKEDYEYERLGTCSLFLAYDLDRGRRYLQVRDRRTKADYADFWDWLTTTHYPDTPKLRIIQDNLNTHTYGSFYEHLPAPRAHQLKNQLDFHFTPKHGSWLNMAEIELSVLVRQCLDRRIPAQQELEREALAWQTERNDAAIQIAWTFTTSKARVKLHRHYQHLNSKH